MSASTVGNPILQKSTVHLYRDCIRLAKYIGSMNGYTKNLHKQVGNIFREHKYETSQEKIEEYKTDATRFLTNFMQHEAERLARLDQAQKQKHIKPSPTLD
ncbi:hypothetical protein PPL_09859 [Heterostelium album PN500]|uniref:Complex 1 LYR protein domain-containing protein n=1 Tax=Heterostelium pallidum (strain ATCC 26659 / Pp 5 / PN500) TaxID=670386 RepID=D3BP96_HETP5|nr:hypothetical protein PPL_09859 [Heterostelium album PN500]EFA77106.1 hypothetical protein PPL_09859 [Heterostelium album PN500]|eukprot:XP_020429235.1 hypothetical protein PPL_09859 [Heterostelium album PN500]